MNGILKCPIARLAALKKKIQEQQEHLNELDKHLYVPLNHLRSLLIIYQATKWLTSVLPAVRSSPATRAARITKFEQHLP